MEARAEGGARGGHPSREAPQRTRRIRPELFLLMASVLISLLLAEVILRLHYVASDSGTLEDLSSLVPPPGAEVKFGDLVGEASFYRALEELAAIGRSSPGSASPA